ncbi:DUF3426 domain-containing protein [Cupriavidus basilensis]|uniref:DUF3426 domain-containing protein n=1 Tax=Cupriavidus basilensis TaxID=68895 RepID=A0ABT6ASG8_9BURK|nr:DUF3426 domain-containing protein [Cupriavidus basilensis]MDF3835565.1 DUF3426 domain-containing protein [Cupriavidus basilensis]
MAAAKLVTRCPACRTAFRLVADQLRLRQGLVRCGQCDTVFDAREHLIELPAPAGGPEPAAQAAASTAAPAAPDERPQREGVGETIQADTPAVPRAPSRAETPLPEAHGKHAADAPPAAQETTQDEAQEPDDARPAIPAFDPGYDPGYDVPALDAPTVMLYQTQAEADQAAQAAGHPAEPEDFAAHDGEDEPSAVFVPGIVDAEDEGTDGTVEAAAAGAADTPAGSHAAPAAPETVSWPRLDLNTLAGDPLAGSDTTHTAGMADAAELAEPGNAANASETATTGRAPAGAEAAAVPSASGYLRAEAQDDFPDIPAAIAHEQASHPWTRTGTPTAAPVFAPDFLRHARERDPGPARRRRVLLRLAIGLLAIAALAQGTYLARSQLAGRLPVLRPAFEAICAPLRCDVAPWRDIDALRIESSQLQKQDEDSDAYLLAVTLRNQGRATVALPAIELVMTDLQDQLLLRRVLQPADYLEADQQAFAIHGLRAGTELPLRVRFRSQQAAANYRVLIFYP